MEAIVTAGSISSPGDPLYDLTGVSKKALIPLLGRPMIHWILEALAGSGLVDRIVIVGLTPDEITFGSAPLYFVDSAGALLANILAGVHKVREINPAVEHILLCSSDIPLITPEIVRGFIAECGSQEADVYYAVVEEKTMEARFPNSRRTFIPFKGGRYSGGDAFLFKNTTVDKVNVELLHALTGSRKNYLSQARMLGFGFIFRFLLRMMTVHEVAKRGGELLNVYAQGVDTRFAELGMDLDKPHQYEIIKADLEQREAQIIK